MSQCLDMKAIDNKERTMLYHACQKGNPYTARTQAPLHEFREYQKFELIHLDLWSGTGTSSLG